MALMSIVRWRTSSSRVRWSTSTDCGSTPLTGTKRMVGRVTASAIAAASAASFFWRRTYAFAHAGGTSNTSWPSRINSRAQ